MGVGRATGKNKTEEATRRAIESPLLETSIKGAKKLILRVAVSEDVDLDEVESAGKMVNDAVHEDVHVIFGAAIDESLNDEIRVSIIATCFEKQNQEPETLKEEKPVEGSTQKTEQTSNSDRQRDEFDDIINILSKK